MEVQGFAHGRFGPVRECFAGILAAQPGTGAAFSAWCDGRLVVDLWGGWAETTAVPARPAATRSDS
jgi:hypothetical protein